MDIQGLNTRFKNAIRDAVDDFSRESEGLAASMSEWETRRDKAIAEEEKSAARTQSLEKHIAQLVPERDALLKQVSQLKQAIALITNVKL